MKVPDKHFVLEKVKKYLQEDIGPSRYLECINVDGWQYAEYSADDVPPNIPDVPMESIRAGDYWGGYDKTAWFKTSVKLPETFTAKKGIKIGLRYSGEDAPGWFSSSPEGLLYINGEAVQGLDKCHVEAILSPRLLNGERLEIAIKTWSGLPQPSKKRVFKGFQIFLLSEVCDEFYFLALTLAEAAELLGQHDLKRIKLVQLLRDSFKKVNFLHFKKEGYYASITDALQFLKNGLAGLRRPEIKPTIHAVGHSHIDMAWLWRVCATREKASRTFSTVLNLMEQYPEYCFMHTSPQLYKFLKDDYPKIFNRVKQKIETGQWEVTGGMWVESDTNIPSGESLVRQFMFGKKYMMDEFNQESLVLWLPDVFGYSAALPQIAKKSGIEYFMTTKISWNQYNHFPHDTFMWRGLDGTDILTHFITTPEPGIWFYTYNGRLEVYETTGIWENYKQKEINDDLLLAYGWGDGGGGPTREMLERCRVLGDIPGIPYVKPAKVEPYFRRLAKQLEGKELEVWDGELYFEYHRGTYTSQAGNKKANRYMENLLHNVEFVHALGQGEYPRQSINEIWEQVLLLQFHDIIPGTSIREVYEDCRADYARLEERGKALLQNGINSISGNLCLSQNSIVIYNSLSRLRDTEVFLPYTDIVREDTAFLDAEGNVMTTQADEAGIFVLLTNIPAMGYKSFALKQKKDAVLSKASPTVEPYKEFDTPYYLIKFNDRGEIISLYDKEAKRLVNKGPLNEIQAFEDKPIRYDAWDIDVFYKEKPYHLFEHMPLKVTCHGPLKTVIRRELRFNESFIAQDMVFYSYTKRIDFKTTIDWNERQVLLKAAFPIDIRSAFASYDIQFGYIERPNHSNSERDFAQFEVCAHKWADLSYSRYGVALLNDCKYGYDCKDSVLRLTLLKSPIYPDETADRQRHEFTYALYPHIGNSLKEVAACGWELNSPALAMEVMQKTEPEDKQNNDFVEFSMLSIEPEDSGVIVDTVKKAEEGGELILRVYQNSDVPENDVTIRFDSSLKITSICETNLMEEPLPQQNAKWSGQSLVFDIEPFEIKTFKVFL